MKTDWKTVSNEVHEIDYVAKKFGVSNSQVMLAKETVGDDRYAIYKYLTEQKAKSNEEKKEGPTGADFPEGWDTGD